RRLIDELQVALQWSRTNPVEEAAAGRRFDAHARADGRGIVHVEQRFEDGREIAPAGGIQANRLQLRIDRAEERHAELDARPAAEKRLFAADHIAIDRLLADDRRTGRKEGRLAELKDILEVVVVEKDAVAGDGRVVFGDFADAARADQRHGEV